MQRESLSTTFRLGSKLPKFDLRSVAGKMVGDSYLREGDLAMVVFSCNHCPYVKGSEEQLIAIVRRFEGQGLRTVVINSNDATKYPEDDFAHMQAKAKEMDLPYPYLHDESQEVARAFDAACTPEVYLFDAAGTLIFHGTVNDSPQDKSRAKRDYLTHAIEQAFAGQSVDPAFVHPIGCSIKWR